MLRLLRMLRRSCRAAVALLLAAGALSAQFRIPSPQPDPLHQSGKNVTISLLTMGDGEDVAAMFGHSAIWVHDNVTRQDTVFNWGEYDLRAPHFIVHFVHGLLLYQMGGHPLPATLDYYRAVNRSVVQQELALTAAQKDTLLSLMRVNAEPQNLVYRYDYFVNNCATRPRDLLDQALGGQLRVGADSLTPHSFRWHTLRLMQSNTPLVLGVDIGLGEPSDKPITKWQEMFLPEKLHDWVATRQVRDSTGALHPLVASERVLFQARRPAEPADAPVLGTWLWLAGLIIGALFIQFGGDPESRSKRIATAMLAGIWSTACGILGAILTFLWLISDHRFAHRNENLLLFNPLWLVLAITLPMYIAAGRLPRTTEWLMRIVALLSLVALIAHAVTLSRQDNLPIIGLALPPALALELVVYRRKVMARPSANPA